MSGVAVVRYLLANYAPLTAEVPAARIMAGPLPLNTVLPAVSVSSVDAVPRLNVAMEGTKRMITERVQVTVLAKSYATKVALLALVRKALPHSRSESLNGVDCDSVLPDALGPDLDDPETQIFSQSCDYIVRWNAA